MTIVFVSIIKENGANNSTCKPLKILRTRKAKYLHNWVGV